jgi:predicted RNase H-like nuclease (RuvC/YqgF family)
MGDESVFIMGFDILPGQSPKSKKSPKFACVIMHEGVSLNEYSEISRGALLKLIREIRPKWLCTDNIFEIAPDSKSLFRLADKIPAETRIVQVTGVPPRQVSLKRLAKRHGLSVRGKPTPLESAHLAAQLALMGVGHSLECFGEQTEIKIARGRKPGRGGQSANRFRRKVHSQIQQMTRHIEDQLKITKIDYDIDVRSSDFGYASARIIAYASLPKIRTLIESKRGGDFKVLISPVRKRVEFLPLEPKPIISSLRPKYFILGIDPGSTAAICMLTLDGKIHRMVSGKSLTRADIIRQVYEQGIPVMVATDVTPVPHFVKKIASTVNAELFVPKREIAVSDKQELAREFSDGIKIRNAHERDALTAAVYAYRSIQSKLQQIERKIRDEQLAVDRNQLKALVIKGMSMKEATASLLHEESKEVEIVPELTTEEEPLTQERFESLLTKHAEAEAENIVLGERVEDLRRYVEFLQFRESELADSLETVTEEHYWKIKRDREIVKKDKELKQVRREVKDLHKEVEKLNKRLENLRGVKRREIRGDMLAIKTVPQFTRESIEEYIQKVGLKSGDIVLFEDASGGGPQTAGLLIDRGIRAVIVDTPLSHLSEEELVQSVIPVISAEEVELQRVDEFAFISRKKFEIQLRSFIDRVRERARQKGEDELVELVERYQREIER